MSKDNNNESLILWENLTDRNLIGNKDNQDEFILAEEKRLSINQDG